MSEEKKWTCDCGCKSTAVGYKREGWIIMSQQQPKEEGK